MPEFRGLGRIPVVERTEPCDPTDHARAEQKDIIDEEDSPPIILWLFGLPITLGLVMWLIDIV